jgi:hypothetical protein
VPPQWLSKYSETVPQPSLGWVFLTCSSDGMISFANTITIISSLHRWTTIIQFQNPLQTGPSFLATPWTTQSAKYGPKASTRWWLASQFYSVNRICQLSNCIFLIHSKAIVGCIVMVSSPLVAKVLPKLLSYPSLWLSSISMGINKRQLLTAANNIVYWQIVKPFLLTSLIYLPSILLLECTTFMH